MRSTSIVKSTWPGVSMMLTWCPVPLAVGGGGRDGDAALLLELHEVHGGADLVLAPHLVDPMDALRVEQDPLGERGLARVDVGADADVSDLREVVSSSVGLAARGGWFRIRFWIGGWVAAMRLRRADPADRSRSRARGARGSSGPGAWVRFLLVGMRFRPLQIVRDRPLSPSGLSGPGSNGSAASDGMGRKSLGQSAVPFKPGGRRPRRMWWAIGLRRVGVLRAHHTGAPGGAGRARRRGWARRRDRVADGPGRSPVGAGAAPGQAVTCRAPGIRCTDRSSTSGCGHVELELRCTSTTARIDIQGP